MDETRATARLSPLTIEVLHRRSPANDAESLTISVTGRPSLAAAVHSVRADALSAMPWMIPLTGWMRLMGAAWQPWLALMAPTVAAAARPHVDKQSSDGGKEINDVEYRDIGAR